MNWKASWNNKDFECERPEWINQVTNRLLDDWENKLIPIDPIGPAIISLSMLEIDPCPTPTVNYFKDDVMFTWSSPKGTLSIVTWDAPGLFFVWLSRNGVITRKWDMLSVNEVREMIVNLFVTIDVRWKSK